MIFRSGSSNYSNKVLSFDTDVVILSSSQQSDFVTKIWKKGGRGREGVVREFQQLVQANWRQIIQTRSCFTVAHVGHNRATTASETVWRHQLPVTSEMTLSTQIALLKHLTRGHVFEWRTLRSLLQATWDSLIRSLYWKDARRVFRLTTNSTERTAVFCAVDSYCSAPLQEYFCYKVSPNSCRYVATVNCSWPYDRLPSMVTR